MPNAASRAIIIAVFDDFPPQIWLLLALAIAAFAPVRYIVRHMAHDPRRRDITLPPEDLSWRSTALLVRCLVAVALLAGIAAFSFTGAAERLVKSPDFMTLAIAAVGLFALYTVWRGVTLGWIEPLSRGPSWRFTRADQPRRFWASMLWNGAIGCLALWLAVAALLDDGAGGCFSVDSREEATEALPACAGLLAGSVTPAEQARILAARGRAHYWLNHDRQALADYTAALDAEPGDAATLYNRALVHERLDQPGAAFADYTRSLALQPADAEALRGRADLQLAAGDFAGAAADYTRLLARNEDDVGALTGRASAREWLGQRSAAAADWRRIARFYPDGPMGIDGGLVPNLPPAALPAAIARLSARLAADPDDEWALFMRGHLHWQAEETDLARNDDDALWHLRQRTGTLPQVLQIGPATRADP